MQLELRIARRMAEAEDGRGRSVMERIATVSVALSLAVMILSLAVVVGFKREISANMEGFSAHVVVTDIRGVHRMDAEPIRASEPLEEALRSEEGVLHLQRYARRAGIVRTKEAVEAVLLKGVDGEYDLTHFREWLTAGKMPRIGDSIRTKDILVSNRLANRLEAEVGDAVEMLFVESDEAPYRDRFKIAGFYSSGMEEMDDYVVLTDLRNVQRLSLWEGDQISGYEILTTSFADAADLAARIDHRLLYDEQFDSENVAAISVEEMNPGTFDWLKAHDVNAAVILVIMLVVAFFNMSVALLILVFERIRMIGVLKALGMQNSALRRIFLFRALRIALVGLVWGNGVGLALCALQQWFSLVKLDAEGYLLSAVPIALEWGWWLLLNGGFLVAILLLMQLPTAVVTTVKPDETMRYE